MKPLGLNRKQEQGLKIAVARFRNNERYTVISGYAGSGKAQPIDTVIPTPIGFKKLGDIEIGDYVFDRNGKQTKVLGVYPQGLKQVYKVTLADGRETYCAPDHLWTCYTENDELVTLTAQEILESGLTYAIPANKPVEYPWKKFNSDPYNIGFFAIQDNYRIPAQYKTGSIEQRTELIRGILDASNIFFEIEFILKDFNQNLLKDIQEVLFSLGCSSVLVDNCLKCDLHYLDKTPIKITALNEEKEMVCIYVDNDEHLYLTNDYIVTHNTYLVKHIIAALGLYPEQVTYAAYTGRAAQVLKNYGCPNAITLHKLLYAPKIHKDGSYSFAYRKWSEEERETRKLIVVDEVSMVPKKIWDDLLNRNIHIIALGDPW